MKEQGRWVAVKIEAESRGSEPSAKRLRTEWGILSQLKDKPTIPKALIFIEHEPVSGASILVQRLYGENLATVVHGRRLERHTASFLASQMLDALEAVHRRH